MPDKYEAWFVDDSPDENRLDDAVILAVSDADAIAKAEEWAANICEQLGVGVLILRRPGQPGSIHSKRFDPFDRK